MSTVPELQTQLVALRAQHAKEIAAAQTTLTKLQEDINYMQEDTDDLEKEEEKLHKEFGGGKNTDAASKDSKHAEILVQVLRGLVDCDESKCSSV